MSFSRRQMLAAPIAAGLAAAWPRFARADSSPYDTLLTASPGDLDLEIPNSQIDGEFPASLHGGRFVVNGPGWNRVGGRTLHPFDGHGYLRSFSFGPQGLRLKARFVRTEAWLAENEAQIQLFNGLGSLVADPDTAAGRRANRQANLLRNVANTTVTAWDGRLLAGWEGGWPYALNESLETQGPESFGGVLGEGEAFLAHTRVDPQSGHLVGLSPRMGRGTVLRLVELQAPGRLVREASFTVDQLMMIHDFIMTPRWVLLTNNPLKVDLEAFLRFKRGRGTLLEAVGPNPEAPSELIMLPRDGGPMRRVPFDQPAFTVHYVNAWDRSDGGVELDLCAFSRFEMGGEFGYRGPNATFDPTPVLGRAPQVLARAQVSSTATRVTMQTLDSRSVDFPRVAGRWEGQPQGYAVAAARSGPQGGYPFDSVTAYKQQDPGAIGTWRPGGAAVLGEPVLAHPPGDPERSTVLALVYEPEQSRCQLVALDPQRPEAGPIASARLPLLPYGFHGVFVEAGQA